MQQATRLPGCHPYLLWSASDVPALRIKAAHPRLSGVRDDLLERCAQYLDPSHPAFIDTTLNRTDLVGISPDCGHTWQKLPDLITAALLTDDPRWYDCLQSVLKVFTQDPSPIKAYIFAHAPTGHAPSLLDGGQDRNFLSQCGMIPLMLDLLWDRLPDGDRRAAGEYLDREIVEPYLAYAIDDPSDPAHSVGLGVNLRWWEFYSCLWSLAVRYDSGNERHRRGMQTALQSVRLGIHLGADTAGVVGEGPQYAAIEAFDWWTGAEIFRRFGMADLWQADERFRKIMQARVYDQFPDDSGILDRGDTARTAGLAGYLIMLLHSHRTGDPVYQAAWERMAIKLNQRGDKPSMHQPLGPLGYWLWLDPEIDPAACRPVDWPTASFAGRFGLHTVRSGWQKDDLYFALCTAGRSPGCFVHQHTDAGHFALAALGEVFCGGRGYGHTPAAYHNVLRVHGREPSQAPPGPNDQSWRGGTTLAAEASPHCHAIAADLSWQWECCWYHRQALVIMLPGADPYVILLDHCNPDNDWARFDWQFQVEPNHRAELSPAEHRAVIQGRKARLDLGFAFQNNGEYPRPPQFELVLEPRRHIYAAATGHPHQSDATTTCLVGRLSSYCGILLTALIPRRGESAPITFRSLHNSRQCGLLANHGDVIDTIVANPSVSHLDIEGVTGEATLAVVRRTRQGELLAACAADCFSLEVDGHAIMQPGGTASTVFEHICAFATGAPDRPAE